MTVETDQERYRRAMHAVQSGVAAKMDYDGADTSVKHLRVGVNSSLVGLGALVRLLVDRGVISEAEYWAAQADAAEEEQRMYESWLSERTGAVVRLG